MKAQRQQQKPAEPVKNPPAKFEDDDVDLEDESETTQIAKEIPKPEPKSAELTKEEEIQQQILMEIELLQNNGRYRVELLHQMQEINRNLVGIAEILVDVAGNVKANK
jgi:predicted TIM-barrel fold metal-dependent hydrolase